MDSAVTGIIHLEFDKLCDKYSIGNTNDSITHGDNPTFGLADFSKTIEKYCKEKDKIEVLPVLSQSINKVTKDCDHHYESGENTNLSTLISKLETESCSTDFESEIERVLLKNETEKSQAEIKFNQKKLKLEVKKDHKESRYHQNITNNELDISESIEEAEYDRKITLGNGYNEKMKNLLNEFKTYKFSKPERLCKQVGRSLMKQRNIAKRTKNSRSKTADTLLSQCAKKAWHLSSINDRAILTSVVHDQESIFMFKPNAEQKKELRQALNKQSRKGKCKTLPFPAIKRYQKSFVSFYEKHYLYLRKEKRQRNGVTQNRPFLHRNMARRVIDISLLNHQFSNVDEHVVIDPITVTAKQRNQRDSMHQRTRQQQQQQQQQQQHQKQQVPQVPQQEQVPQLPSKMTRSDSGAFIDLNIENETGYNLRTTRFAPVFRKDSSIQLMRSS